LASMPFKVRYAAGVELAREVALILVRYADRVIPAPPLVRDKLWDQNQKVTQVFDLNRGDGGGGRIRTYEDVRRQIYSLLPLTARQPLRDRMPSGAAESGS
jgi:hypothetical protein